VALESIGCEVVAMDGGPAALEAWEQQQGQFDVLVTDLAMPDMRGEVLAATLLERSATLRAVLATGYVDRAIDLSAFEGRFKLAPEASRAPRPGRRARPPLTHSDSMTIGSPYCVGPSGGSRCVPCPQE
jgi:CheY-like chemotaxis protein